MDWTAIVAGIVGLLVVLGLGYGLGRWARGGNDGPASGRPPQPTLTPEAREEIAREVASEDDPPLLSDRYGIPRKRE